VLDGAGKEPLVEPLRDVARLGGLPGSGEELRRHVGVFPGDAEELEDEREAPEETFARWGKLAVELRFEAPDEAAVASRELAQVSE